MERKIAALWEKLEEHERRIESLERISEQKTERKAATTKKSTLDLLMELKDASFFKKERTLSEILEALHAKGRIIKNSSLPPYLLKMVRANIIRREKKMVGKKRVWVYFE